MLNKHTRYQLPDRWMAEHLPNAMTGDPIAVSDLADELMKAAEQEDIPLLEINEAMEHREGSLAD
ncbi:DUF768 domain-containing protein [Mesorhizobium sp. M4B.F.Ca.ET.190.01.1.1]|nr:DUF768 domain-containing protein [Mesorhizobium sp. M4B.F.Ca.ET.200.01.1.1]TGS23035.1 DUF768 domain-containing protein [Mesorhizobium sp. M4B.F.Ca.ET.190.01.1.1]TGT33870.1 DUF768 domain-containing protein [Mesorhizobium sp. M4B.F.Ca.ET.172.01.1.1]